LAVLFAHIGELNRIADEIDQDLRDELRALRELRRQSTGAFVFASERGGPMRTCFGIRAAICSRMRATTRGDCSCGSAMSISNTPRTTAN